MSNLYESDKNVPIHPAPDPVPPIPLEGYPIEENVGVPLKDTTPNGDPLEP